jgi:hypothetical protein
VTLRWVATVSAAADNRDRVPGLSARTAPLARRLWIGLSAALLVVVAALVIYGMAIGANPEFDRGRSPTSSVVAQELIGLLTLFAAGASAVELARVLRGKAGTRLPRLLISVVLLAVVWWIAPAC